MTVKEYNISVERYSDDLYRFILKSIRDKDVAHDVVQDTFVKVWKTAENISFAKAKSYLFSTAYHTMIDWTRREKKKERFDAVDQTEYAHCEQYSDTKEILDRALNRLPEQQKNLVLLRDYEGYSYQEIGEICDLSEAQVKVYIFRARKTLKSYLVSVETII